MSANPTCRSAHERTRSDAHPLRAISFGDPAVTIERRDDGTIYLRPKMALGDYPVRLTDRLHHWAEAEPNRVFMAERDAGARLAADHLRAIAGLRAGISPRRCSRAVSRPRSRSSFSPAIRSITRCSRSARSMRASRSVRCRRPIRWCRRITASSAYLMKLLTPGLVFADDADQIRRRARRQCSRWNRDRGLARRSCPAAT